MFNTFFEDKKDLVTIDEFAQSINSTKDQVLEYISKGVLFPIVEIKSGYYVRRIPSLLTEFLSEALQVSNRDAYNSLFTNNNQHRELYTDYCEQLEEFSKKNQNGKLLPHTEMLPWESDILITESSFVFAQPDVIIDTQWGKGYLPQYITHNHPRFNIAGITGEDLYMNFLESDYKIEGNEIIINGKTMDIGIENRALGGNNNKKPIFYFPDNRSIEFSAYKCKQHFPLPIHLAINILQLENTAFTECGTSYDKLSLIITQKLISIFAEKDKIDFDLFNDLIILGTLADRWVPIGSAHMQNENLNILDFNITFSSNSIYINETQFYTLQNLNGWGHYNLVKFKKSILDRYKLRNYMIYNKYLYYIHKNLKSYKDKRSKETITTHLDNCFIDAKEDLYNDVFFCQNSYYTGAESSTINDHSQPYSSSKSKKMARIDKKNMLKQISTEGKLPATESEPDNIVQTSMFTFLKNITKK